MEYKFYNKKDAEKLCKSINKKDIVTKNGITYCEIAIPFQVARGKWLILHDLAATDFGTMETKYTMSLMYHTVQGTSQEDCYCKIIACLIGDLINGKN